MSKQEETKSKKSKKVIWIVGGIIVLMIIGALTDDESESSGEAESSDVQAEEVAEAEASAESVDYDALRKKLGSPKSFDYIVINKSSLNLYDLKGDRFCNYLKLGEGIAFSDAGNSMKVISVDDDDGVFVAKSSATDDESTVAYVETDEGGYVDGDYLHSGVYVRKGTYRYTNVLGAKATVPKFKKVTREKDIQIYFAAMRAALPQVPDNNLDFNSGHKVSCKTWKIVSW